MNKVKTIALAIPAMIALTASGGYASTILTVDNSLTTTHFQQNFDDPCIYGGNDCQPAPGFPTETSIAVGGGVSIVDAGTAGGGASNSLPVLFNATVSQIIGLEGGAFGNVFMIGVDINQTGSSPTITVGQFEVWDTTTNTELANLTPGTPLTTFANGTGFSDALLSSVNLTGLTHTDNIQFRLQYSGANDGTDSFFLVSTAAPPPVVPEPVSSALIGTGLIGLFFMRRRKQNS